MPPSGRQDASRDYYRELVRKAATEHRLLSVHWELTSHCNCRCTHCYVVKPGDPGFRARAPELSTLEVKEVIDQLAAHNALNITFTGGEILCRSDFFEIARHARTRRFAVRLMTNGTQIGAAEADQIAALYPVSVEMSVYGPSAERHDAITQVPGSFERTMQAFRLLAERGIHTRFKSPMMHDNVQQFAQLRSLAESLGAVFCFDITIVPKDDGSTAPLHHRMTDDDLSWLVRQAMKDQDLPTPQSRDLGSPVCLSGLNQVNIDPYGTVYPCVQIRIPAGSVRERTIAEIWRSSPILQRLRSLTRADFAQCAACSYRDICVPCPGVALLEDGDLLGPSSVACREARLRYQVLREIRLQQAGAAGGPQPSPRTARRDASQSPDGSSKVEA